MRGNVVQVRSTPNLQNGSDLAPAEQQRECPECGEAFTLRGLYGHLRLAHGMKGRALAKVAEAAQPVATSEVEEVAELLRRFRDVVAMWEEFDALRRCGGFKKKINLERFQKAINRQADALKVELQRHGIILTREYVQHLRGFEEERNVKGEAEEEGEENEE